MMNPPHLGHVAVVETVHRATGVDRVVVVPAGIPPHRRAPSVSARARLTMAVRAFADLPHVVVSDSEVERGEHGEVGYMVDTLEELLELPEQLGYDDLSVSLSLVVGADQAATLPEWHRFERIVEIARIAVLGRPDHIEPTRLERDLDRLTALGARIDDVAMVPVAISSTMVRAAAARGARDVVRGLVPAAIVDDVMRLYRSEPGD